MAIEIKAPQFPESVADGTIATWHKKEGDAVKRDDLLVDIETDKVVLEVVAMADGVMGKILKGEDETIESQELLGYLEEGGAAAAPAAAAPAAEQPAAQEAPAASTGTPAAAGPAARKAMSAAGVDAAAVTGSGKGGRITPQDVAQAVEQRGAAAPAGQSPAAAAAAAAPAAPGDREERRVPMTRLRKRVAERLLDAQHNSAMLTTFNEVNMKPIMQMRKDYQSAFEKAHGVRLGFMSFFVRACVEALKRFPAVNASIDGDDIVYHGYYDVGVAVSTERGLVVPILRDADLKGLAEVESQIIEYGSKARDGKLSIEDMTGGTFTISNGGIFGSLLSTPILNPPQTAILGMHKIQERPMAVDGKVEILPMMYLALSYDHRLIDGKEAVQFLVAVKNFIEDPARLLLDI
ncbi:2-oxoglutarate dehydrogenase complex dihydrolipoyllysine-residue succinyltransferase [Isoalcanivorax beigongshangi]|uniref:Dihydrolipoyllysine-residue succinyltransferase component of 2-oxoglutarate dehydrogenase complex n=1 Tax=Isoalcanivorax beigongshangi TaxID=3238810 RepID=A0ABV4AJZ5_9GAMM